MQQDNTYKPSGRVSGPGLMSAIGTIIGYGVGVGALYGVISYYSPFIFINMIVWVASAMALGHFAEEAVRDGKLRNSVVASIVGALAAIIAIVVHWAVWLRLTTEQWILDPATAKMLLEGIAAVGAWSAFDWTPQGNTLLTIWGLEALLFFVMPTVITRNVVRDTPFCEESGTWAEVRYPKKNFAKCDIKNLGKKIRQSPDKILDLLQRPQASDSAFTRFALARAADSGLRTVAISRVTTKKKDGKIEESTKTVLKHIVVDESTFDAIAAACGVRLMLT